MNQHKKPNVVIVITDDQGYGDLGCHGNPEIRTPYIDKLFSQSIRFTDYHTGPTCAPTRAGLLTGHYHNSTGVWHTIGGRSLLRKDEVSMANVFQDNGYKTGIFGKWHLGDNYPYRPHDRGFEESVVHGGGGIGQTPDYWGNDYFDDTYFVNGKEQKYEGYCTDVFFNLGLDFVERHQDTPFLCFIATNAPHIPLNVDKKYSDLYIDSVPEDRAKFYGMITNIDENVGKFRNRLQELGLEENTIFIFMTDNGTYTGCELDRSEFITEGYNAGMRGRKGSAYDGGHRVPFFLHWPAQGWTKGRDIPQLAANVDVMPTFIELCGLRKPESLQFDGISLAALLQGDNAHWEDRSIVTDSQRVPQPIKWRSSTVMTQRWRLINGESLYDIASDPEQKLDVASSHPQVVSKLRADYDLWWKKVSRQFDEDIPIVIGTDHEHITDLTAHDWRADLSDVPWSQYEIRVAKACNSYWEIEVSEDGEYHFDVRRWPLEENRSMTEGIPGEIDWYNGGRALSLRLAHIKIGDYKESKPVNGQDKFVRFTVILQKGSTRLQTYLEDDNGTLIGAYYVYISKLIC